MRDPYIYEDCSVIKNKLGIKTQDELDDAEADYVVYRLKDLALNPMPGDYNTEHLLKMHYLVKAEEYKVGIELNLFCLIRKE